MLLIVVGTLLIYIATPYLNTEFAHALGHAFIIAAILAATVDHYVKERVLREVSLDVSKYLVGYRLPEEVQDRIRDLMQTRWIRRKFEVRFSFTEHRNQKLKIDIRISEEIQNITSEPLEYQDSISFAKHEPATLLELDYDSGDAGGAYHLGREELVDRQTESEGRYISTGNKVRIPAVAEALGENYRFRARYELLYPVPHSELITFNQPTIGVSIEVSDIPEGYRIYVDPPADVTAHHRWEYRRLFLPGEHIQVLWERSDVGRNAR